MTIFQILALAVLVVLFARELIAINRQPRAHTVLWFRAFIWLAAIIAIGRPDWVQQLARTTGIQRGADFVFYLFVLAFLGVSFHFYSRIVRLQRQLTQVIRCQALQEAQHGPQ